MVHDTQVEVTARRTVATWAQQVQDILQKMNAFLGAASEEQDDCQKLR